MLIADRVLSLCCPSQTNFQSPANFCDLHEVATPSRSKGMPHNALLVHQACHYSDIMRTTPQKECIGERYSHWRDEFPTGVENPLNSLPQGAAPLVNGDDPGRLQDSFDSRSLVITSPATTLALTLQPLNSIWGTPATTAASGLGNGIPRAGSLSHPRCRTLFLPWKRNCQDIDAF